MKARKCEYKFGFPLIFANSAFCKDLSWSLPKKESWRKEGAPGVVQILHNVSDNP